MSRALVWGVFAAGLGVVLWVAAGYAATSPLALVVLALIIAAYLAGAWELQRFEQDSTALAQALESPPQTLQELSAWLAGVPSRLRLTVARRIDGERVGLPGPTMAPYLVGLLVLLGMLGTFLGMVVTLKGAVVALDRTTDLPALREALSAPVKGLGLAFGTSVAGVAASAALGLLVALARRHRAQVSQALDVATSGPLREFSAALQWAQQREAQRLSLQREQQQEQQAQQLKQQQAAREERQERQAQQQAFQQAQAELMQAQAQLPPQMLAQWQAAMAQMQRQAEALEARLLAGQERFHAQAQSVHAELAAAVQRSLQEHLRDSLAETARVSREGLQPMVAATLQGLAQQAQQVQAHTQQAVQQHLEGVGQHLQAALTAVEAGWARQFAQQSQLAEDQAQGLRQTLLAFNDTFGQRSSELLASVAQAHGALHEALRAALVAEDGQRAELAASLGTLLQTLDRTAAEQRSAVDVLLASSATVLQQVGERFIGQVDAAAAALAEAGGQLQGGAIEVASLGEAFGVAVRQFVDTSRGLGESLQRIDDALRKSTARSDDQLAYYVAQARELIELSVASQKQVIDGLQGVVRATTSGPAGADAAAGQAAAAPLHQGATSVAEAV